MQDTGAIQQASLPLYEARGRLKFLGILSIAQMVMAAFTIIGPVSCWLPLWIDMLLLGFVSRLEHAAASGQVIEFVEAHWKPKTDFIVNGILTL